MPEYDPNIHEPVIIDPQAFEFVRAYTDIDSPTFGNAYRSAMSSGYSPSYARVIGSNFPKNRIKKLLKDMKSPLAKAVTDDLQTNPGHYGRPSKRAEKRMKTTANRRWKELEAEIRLLDIE